MDTISRLEPWVITHRSLLNLPLIVIMNYNLVIKSWLATLLAPGVPAVWPWMSHGSVSSSVKWVVTVPTGRISKLTNISPWEERVALFVLIFKSVWKQCFKVYFFWLLGQDSRTQWCWHSGETRRLQDSHYLGLDERHSQMVWVHHSLILPFLTISD